MRTKRIIIATLSGLLFGFVCYSFAASGPIKLPWAITAQIIASRTVMGFAIGMSCFCFKWPVNGLLLGLIFSIPLAFSGFMGGTEEMSGSMIFISTIVMGMIYGLLIELITSVLFKAKVERKE